MIILESHSVNSLKIRIITDLAKKIGTDFQIFFPRFLFDYQFVSTILAGTT